LERGRGFRAVGIAASKLAAPVLARRGGRVLVSLKAEWGAIVGPEWHAVTWPTALGRDGVLKLRAASGGALELQHRAPLVIERINQFFGRLIVTRLALLQAPLPLPSSLGAPPLRPLLPWEEQALDERLWGIADPELREALARLGRAVIAAEI
jgi:hypothetical protein